MTIVMTLSEVLQKCDSWEAFCDEYGWNYYAVKEGGGDIEVRLTKEEAAKHGII